MSKHESKCDFHGVFDIPRLAQEPHCHLQGIQAMGGSLGIWCVSFKSQGACVVRPWGRASPRPGDGCPSQDCILDLLRASDIRFQHFRGRILCTPCLEFCRHVVWCLFAQREEDKSRNLLENGFTVFNSLSLKDLKGLAFLFFSAEGRS